MQWPDKARKQLLNKELFDAPAKGYLATSAEMSLEHNYKQGASPDTSRVCLGFTD